MTLGAFLVRAADARCRRPAGRDDRDPGGPVAQPARGSRRRWRSSCSASPASRRCSASGPSSRCSMPRSTRGLFPLAVVGIVASVIGAYYYLRDRQDDVLRRAAAAPSRRGTALVNGALIAARGAVLLAARHARDRADRRRGTRRGGVAVLAPCGRRATDRFAEIGSTSDWLLARAATLAERRWVRADAQTARARPPGPRVGVGRRAISSPRPWSARTRAMARRSDAAFVAALALADAAGCRGPAAMRLSAQMAQRLLLGGAQARGHPARSAGRARSSSASASISRRARIDAIGRRIACLGSRHRADPPPRPSPRRHWRAAPSPSMARALARPTASRRIRAAWLARATRSAGAADRQAGQRGAHRHLRRARRRRRAAAPGCDGTHRAAFTPAKSSGYGSARCCSPSMSATPTSSSRCARARTSAALADRHRSAPHRRRICGLAEPAARRSKASTARASTPRSSPRSCRRAAQPPVLCRNYFHVEPLVAGSAGARSRPADRSAQPRRSRRGPAVNAIAAHAKHAGRPHRRRFRHRDHLRRGRLRRRYKGGIICAGHQPRSTRWSPPPPSCRASRSRRPPATRA